MEPQLTEEEEGRIAYQLFVEYLLEHGITVSLGLPREIGKLAKRANVDPKKALAVTKKIVNEMTNRMVQ